MRKRAHNLPHAFQVQSQQQQIGRSSSPNGHGTTRGNNPMSLPNATTA